MAIRTKALHVVATSWFVVCALACVTGGLRAHHESERAARAAWLRKALLVDHAGSKPEATRAEATDTGDPRAAAEAHRLIDDAVRTKIWSAADARRMRSLVLRMSAADRDRVLHRFATTSNAREFKVDTGGLPPA